MSAFPFRIDATDGAARTGVIQTPRGEIRTPAFMPVGTAGTVKGLLTSQVRSAGADILLGNTYHLMLRPGAERVKRLGGLHRFMGWDGAILTDSGGFQVMSLNELNKVREEGVEFRSHLDGSKHLLTPESAMQIQDGLGTDIAMSFDHLVRLPAPIEALRDAVDRTLRWAQRGLVERARMRVAGRGVDTVLFDRYTMQLPRRVQGVELRLGDRYLSELFHPDLRQRWARENRAAPPRPRRQRAWRYRKKVMAGVMFALDLEGRSSLPGGGPDKHRVCCSKQQCDRPRPVGRRALHLRDQRSRPTRALRAKFRPGAPLPRARGPVFVPAPAREANMLHLQ